MLIHDFKQGEGVKFYWSTKLPVKIYDKFAVISGNKGEVRISIPDDCTLSIDKLPLFDGSQQNR